MKKRTKAILVTVCAIFLVTASVLGTLAYLTDDEEVVNTFTIGNVDITLDEAEVDSEGVPVEGADRVKGNEYHLVPGKTYTKDPTVKVIKGSEESYIRMLVTINKAKEIKDIFGEDFLPENYVDGWDKSIWPCVAIKDNGDNTITYEFRYHESVNAFSETKDIELEPLFETFTLPGEIDGEQLKTITDLKITVEAHAIQASGFEDVEDAWEAFDKQIGE